MSQEIKKIDEPHHIQQPLCTTRLPYRQGRKLTAVKVYSVASESNHLLVFGVPSLNLRQETKALFSKYGNLLQFNISLEHKSEKFTETYHARFVNIQSARVAKRMLDNKNFYGGSLHVCYAPELETVEETRSKLIKRSNDVLSRIRTLRKEEARDIAEDKAIETGCIKEKKAEETAGKPVTKLNMGETNKIEYANPVVVCKKRKRTKQDCVVEEKKPFGTLHHNTSGEFSNHNNDERLENLSKECIQTNIEVVDCTSVDKDTITNINETLNYDKFGSELVIKLPTKSVNRIKFNLCNKNTS